MNSFSSIFSGYKRRVGYHFFYKSYVKYLFKRKMGYIPNLINPVTFNEKLTYIKTSKITKNLGCYVDKVAVREYVASCISDDVILKVHALYSDLSINISELPDKFVLKPSHSSGRVIICRDKEKFDLASYTSILKEWLTHDYFYEGGEWCYKGLKPLIICEELIEDINIIDYKFYCFNGVPKYIYVYVERELGVKTKVYDMDWNEQTFVQGYKRYDKSISKPKFLKLMTEYARLLSQRFDFVRVDFYETNDKVLFGELTFFPYNGTGRFYTQDSNDYDVVLGDLLMIRDIT